MENDCPLHDRSHSQRLCRLLVRLARRALHFEGVNQGESANLFLKTTYKLINPRVVQLKRIGE